MTDAQPAPSESKTRPLPVAIAGAVLGGAVGYSAFKLLLNSFGLYAMVLPGAMVGVGRATGSTAKSIPVGVVCFVGAVLISIITEWSVTVMPEDATFVDFLAALPDKPFRNQASLVAGPIMALWFGIGRNETPQSG